MLFILLSENPETPISDRQPAGAVLLFQICSGNFLIPTFLIQFDFLMGAVVGLATMRDKSYSWYENTYSTIIVLFTFAIAMAILLIIDNGNLSYDTFEEYEYKYS